MLLFSHYLIGLAIALVLGMIWRWCSCRKRKDSWNWIGSGRALQTNSDGSKRTARRRMKLWNMYCRYTVDAKISSGLDRSLTWPSISSFWGWVTRDLPICCHRQQELHQNQKNSCDGNLKQPYATFKSWDSLGWLVGECTIHASGTS